MYRLLRNHKLSLTILIFIVTYYFIQLLKPDFLYKKNGELRQFGIGYKGKTIFPAWLLSIILAILTYVLVCYYTLKR
tara:strand:- start:3879 stop:4109 length:231 start_codon:yes stop_codon:yes gene_type:complete